MGICRPTAAFVLHCFTYVDVCGHACSLWFACSYNNSCCSCTKAFTTMLIQIPQQLTSKSAPSRDGQLNCWRASLFTVSLITVDTYTGNSTETIPRERKLEVRRSMLKIMRWVVKLSHSIEWRGLAADWPLAAAKAEETSSSQRVCSWCDSS